MTLYTNFRWGFDGSRQEMLVETGRVVARPAPTTEKLFRGEVVDLDGKYLLPAFIDAHCHFLPTGLDLLKLNLGACETHEEVLEAVRDWEPNLEPGKWLHAVHYDQTRFPDGAHLTRDRLDAVCPNRPVLLRHVSGHASVANSAALRAAHIAEDVKDPRGGSFERDAAGRLTGVLLEKAHEHVSAAAPEPTFEEMVEAILRAGKRMSELGIACAADMMTGRFGLDKELKAYEEAETRGCKCRLRLYPVWSSVFGGRGTGRDALLERVSGWDMTRLKLAGIKIFADGAVGAGTAAIYGSYANASGTSTPLPPPPIAPASRQGEGELPATSGQLIYSPERLKQMVQTAHEAGFQLAVHSIGDFATDLVMDAFEATGEPSRHRIEHAMLVSDAQIERLARLNCHVAMQPEFLVRFGHAYKRQLGPERASKIKRFRSVVDAGLTLSLNSDRPIVSGDPWVGVRCASDRPEGFDPAENLTRAEALMGYTRHAAQSTGEQDLMGSLEAGQLADWVACETDPLVG